MNAITTLNDIQANTDRILNTPLPLAYAIAISQLTWVYILILPFQLYTSLGMITIPGTLCTYMSSSKPISPNMPNKILTQRPTQSPPT